MHDRFSSFEWYYRCKNERIAASTATYFTYASGLLVNQKTGSNNLNFVYSPGGQALGFNYNGSNYFYLRNAQNDIIGIYDSTGTVVVNYIYDSWGKLISTTGSLATTIGVINPLRYRGYYYDTETGLYYLESRYYDPETGRFINADGQLNPELVGKNLFAYCFNNPVMLVDSDGKMPIVGDSIQESTSAERQLASLYMKELSAQRSCSMSSIESLTTKGTPNSKDTLHNPDGTPKQDRWYDKDGNAERDRDYNHPGDMPFPHDHKWENGVRKKPHLPPSPSYNIDWKIVGTYALGCVLLVSATVYFVYSGDTSVAQKAIECF